MNLSYEARFISIPKIDVAACDAEITCRNYFSALKDKAGSMFNSHKLRLSGNWILYRLKVKSDLAADASAAVAPIQVKFKRNILCRLDGRKGGRQDFEWDSSQLSESDVFQRLTLFLVRPFIDEDVDGATAEMDRFWPMRRESQSKAIK